MRHFLTLILIVFGNSPMFAQKSDEEKKIFPINEFTLSLNRTTVADENTQDRFGFGVGLCYAFFNQKRCNLITGLEYNRNVQFKKSMYMGHYGRNYNVTYTINNFGLPVYFRVNMGQKVKFFIETGVFLNFISVGREKGISAMFFYSNTDSTMKQSSGQFNNPISYGIDYGISGGIGLRIPIQKHEILLKGDYKWGMRAIYSYQDSIYNRYWRVMIGFKANIGKKFYKQEGLPNKTIQLLQPTSGVYYVEVATTTQKFIRKMVVM